MYLRKSTPKGQTLIMTAFLLVLFVLPVWAFITNQGQVQIDYAQASDIGLTAARAGAATIDTVYLDNTGNLSLNTSTSDGMTAQQACMTSFIDGVKNNANDFAGNVADDFSSTEAIAPSTLTCTTSIAPGGTFFTVETITAKLAITPFIPFLLGIGSTTFITVNEVANMESGCTVQNGGC